MTENPYDIVVVGGGPIGLYAGFRSALLFLSVHIVNKGRKWSRAFHVPKYENFPTKLGGISGSDVIDQLRENLAVYPDYVSIDDFVTITSITRHNGIFTLQGLHNQTKNERTYRSRVVVLATGIVDRQPIIRGQLKNIFPYANNQLLCYCVICDGHLVEGKDAAVIGSGTTAVLTALDLLHFKAKTVTILTHGKPLFLKEEREKIEYSRETIEAKGISVVTDEILSLFGVERGLFGVRLSEGRELSFGVAFSAMGLYKINNDLALMLGGKIDEKGYIVVDEALRVLDKNDKPIPGLYAIGDVNHNWNQLMIGFGDADKAVIDAWANYLDL